jgi:hypothetical protein
MGLPRAILLYGLLLSVFMAALYGKFSTTEWIVIHAERGG